MVLSSSVFVYSWIVSSCLSIEHCSHLLWGPLILQVINTELLCTHRTFNTPSHTRDLSGSCTSNHWPYRNHSVTCCCIRILKDLDKDNPYCFCDCFLSLKGWVYIVPQGTSWLWCTQPLEFFWLGPWKVLFNEKLVKGKASNLVWWKGWGLQSACKWGMHLRKFDRYMYVQDVPNSVNRKTDALTQATIHIHTC